MANSLDLKKLRSLHALSRSKMRAAAAPAVQPVMEDVLAKAEALAAAIPRDPSARAVPQRLDELHRAAGSILPTAAPQPLFAPFPPPTGAVMDDHESRALRLLASVKTDGAGAGEGSVGERFDAARARREIARLELHGAADDSEDEDDTLDAAGATYSEHLREVDVSGFLAHHHDMVVATAIEDVRSATQDELDEALQREQDCAWRAEL